MARYGAEHADTQEREELLRRAVETASELRARVQGMPMDRGSQNAQRMQRMMAAQAVSSPRFNPPEPQGEDEDTGGADFLNGGETEPQRLAREKIQAQERMDRMMAAQRLPARPGAGTRAVPFPFPAPRHGGHDDSSAAGSAESYGTDPYGSEYDPNSDDERYRRVYEYDSDGTQYDSDCNPLYGDPEDQEFDGDESMT